VSVTIDKEGETNIKVQNDPPDLNINPTVPGAHLVNGTSKNKEGKEGQSKDEVSVGESGDALLSVKTEEGEPQDVLKSQEDV